jgi:dehydrogenase/reductase SDR family protein 7B
MEHSHLMDTNYLGTVALTKAVLPSMIAQKSGTICTVSSVQGVLAVPERTAYAASKHAVQGFFNSLRLEVADHNIDVTLALPGYVATQLSQNALTADGGLYGRTDDTTANGMTPAYVSYQIVNAISKRVQSVLIADTATSIAVYLDRWFPSLMFHVV